MKLTIEQIEQMVMDEMYKKYDRKGPLGKYVFPKNLTGPHRREHPDAKKERDTPLEKILSRALSAHVSRNNPLPNDVIKKFLAQHSTKRPQNEKIKKGANDK